MIKLACNYYPETETLVRERWIDIDYFKFPALAYQMEIFNDGSLERFREFISRAGEVRPFLLHGLSPAPHDLSSPSLRDDFDFDTVNALLEITNTPGISLHPCGGGVDASVTEAALIKTIVENIIFIREHYPNAGFISVENLDSPRYGALLKHEVVSEIIIQSGCSLLLDVSHAFCASWFTHVDFKTYLSKLPLERVREIHLNGWAVKGSDIMSHLKINEEGYEVLKELLNCCRPDIVTIEYGRHNDRLGIGCPVLTPEGDNAGAKTDIIEQAARVGEILSRYN